jgi:hypothetical protein
MAIEFGELKFVPIPENAEGRDALKYTHFMLSEPIRNLLCLHAKGERQKIGWLYLIAYEAKKVTCPECLEMIHS